MKPLPTLLVFTAALWLPALPASAQFDRDDRDKAAAKRTRDDPYGAKAEKRAWDAWVQSLGKGPVFQVEILWRWPDDNRLYYLRTMVSPKKPRGGVLVGLGVDAKGKVLHPPDPMYQRVLQGNEAVASIKSAPPPLPLALSTHYVGVNLRSTTPNPIHLDVRASGYLDGTLLQMLSTRAAQERTRSLRKLAPEEAAVLALLQRRLKAEAQTRRVG